MGQEVKGLVLFLFIRNRTFFLTVLEDGEAKIKVPPHSVTGNSSLSSVLTLAVVQLLAPIPMLVNEGNLKGFLFVCLLASLSIKPLVWKLFPLRYLSGSQVTPHRLLEPGRWCNSVMPGGLSVNSRSA